MKDKLFTILMSVLITTGVLVLGAQIYMKHRLDQMSKFDMTDKEILVTKMLMEASYFEGQKDAMKGQYHIQKKDSNYVWSSSSPWVNYGKVSYMPALTIQSNIDMIVK